MNPIIKDDLDKLIKENNTQLEKLKNKRVFIVGANSLIAKYFTYLLLEANKQRELNIKVLILVRNLGKAEKAFKEYFNSSLEIINQDVCDKIEYKGGIDYIVHSAGSASPQFIINDPVGILKANTIGTFNVLDLAKEKSVKNVLFTSTREIYGKTLDGIKYIKEEDMGSLDPIEPRNGYPESKRISESIFVSYSKQFNIPYTILRIAHTYGPGMEIKDDGRVMADFISCVTNNKNITLNSDGTAIRSFCYITDTVEGILKTLVNDNKNEVYNLSNEKEPYQIREVAEKLVELYPEKKLKVEFADHNNVVLKGGYNKIPLVQLDTGKLESVGWYPKVKLLDGLKRTVDYFENEKTRIGENSGDIS